MTTYTFSPTVKDAEADWGDDATWAGGVVPDSADADVEVPSIAGANDALGVASGEGFSVRSVALDDNLELYGTLTIAQNFVQEGEVSVDMNGGTLAAGTLSINAGYLQGDGQVNVAGLLTNNGSINGGGMAVDAGQLTNNGTLSASSENLTVTVSPGGFRNLAGSTLTGGTYQVGSSYDGGGAGDTLYLDVGALITEIAANLVFAGGDIQSYDPITARYESLRSSVGEILSGGSLTVDLSTVDWGDLVDSGAIVLNTGTLVTPSLTVASGGTVTGGGGEIEGPIVNDGVITAGNASTYTQPLILAGPIVGTGVLEIAAGLDLQGNFYSDIIDNKLELGASSTEDVDFANNVGTLQLDDPRQFQAAITTSGWGDVILLKGIQANSVTSYAYQGDADEGTLTLDTAAGDESLTFLGDFSRANFALTPYSTTFSTSYDSVTVTLVSAPSGIYNDSAADLSALTPDEITALAAGGVTELNAIDASVRYTFAQSVAIEAAGLKVAAPSGDLAKESFADGTSDVYYYGPNDESPPTEIVLTRKVVFQADGSFDDYQYVGYSGQNVFLGAYYDEDVVSYSAGGVRQSITFYGESTTYTPVASETFTAFGGYIAYVNGALARARTVQADGAFDVRHYGVSGVIAGETYTSFDVAFTAAGIRDAQTYYDADDDILVSQTFSGNGGFTLTIGGALYETKTVNADGSFQVAFTGDGGQPATPYQTDFSAAGHELAHTIDTGAGSGTAVIYGSGLQIDQPSGTIGPDAATDDFSYVAHASEIYDFLVGANDDVINLASGFGAATIDNFGAASAATNVVNATALFATYAAAQAAMTTTNGNTILTDASGDTLTFAGVAESSLTAARLGFG